MTPWEVLSQIGFPNSEALSEALLTRPLGSPKLFQNEPEHVGTRKRSKAVRQTRLCALTQRLVASGTGVT